MRDASKQQRDAISCKRDDNRDNDEPCKICGLKGDDNEVPDDPDSVNGVFCEKCERFIGMIGDTRGQYRASLLFQYCVHREWDKALRRVKYCPEEAAQDPDECGFGSLHWAVYGGAPKELILALIEAYPKHIAPPIWMVLKRSIGGSGEIIEAMVTANPSCLGSMPMDGTRVTALGHLSRNYNRTFAAKLTHLKVDSPQSEVEQLEAMVWKRAQLYVKGDYYGTCQDPLPNGKEFRIIHAIAGCRDPFLETEGILSFAIKVHPDQLAEMDEDGQLPLHLAASTVCRTRNEFAPEEEEYFTGTDVGLEQEFGYPRACSFHDKVDEIKILLKAHPKAAKIRNQRGKLALHLALASGKKWAGGLHEILQAFPGAIAESDNESRLLPFMMAAARERPCLDTTFELLRASPELDRFGAWMESASVDGPKASTSASRACRKAKNTI